MNPKVLQETFNKMDQYDAVDSLLNDMDNMKQQKSFPPFFVNLQI